MTSIAQSIPCPVCTQPLAVRLATGRKSQKTFVMLVCGVDGRHFRAFINDRNYIDDVLGHLRGPIGGENPVHDGKP